MTTSEFITRRYIATVAAAVPGHVSELPGFLASTIQVFPEAESTRLIAVRQNTVVASSRKLGNAFVDLKQLVHGLFSMAVDVASAYAAPFLVVPLVIKMAIEAIDLATIELSEFQVAFVVAIHELSAQGEKALLATVSERAGQVLAQAGRPATITAEIAVRILGELEELGCINSLDTSGYELSERVTIHA